MLFQNNDDFLSTDDASLASSLSSASITKLQHSVGFPLMSYYYPTTGKCTYSVSGLTTVQPQIIFPTKPTLYLPLDFNRASTNMFLSGSLTSAKVIRLQAKDTIFKVEYCNIK